MILKILAVALMLATPAAARTLVWDGSTDTLAAALTPDVSAVVLQSHGGSFDWAVHAAEIVQQRHIHTVVNTYCESACALVFVAGNHPAAAPHARLMFHAVADPVAAAKHTARCASDTEACAREYELLRRHAFMEFDRYLITLYDLSHNQKLVWLASNRPATEPWGVRGNFTELAPLEMTGAEMKLVMAHAPAP